MAESGPDRCPRCGGSFQCGAQAAAPCPCTTLELPTALLTRLRQRYTGCLCLHCLRDLASGGGIEPSDTFSSPPCP